MGSAISGQGARRETFKEVSQARTKRTFVFTGEVIMNLQPVTLGCDDGHNLAHDVPAVDVAAPIHPEENHP